MLWSSSVDRVGIPVALNEACSNQDLIENLEVIQNLCPLEPKKRSVWVLVCALLDCGCSIRQLCKKKEHSSTTVKYGSKDHNLNSRLSGDDSKFFLNVRFRDCLYFRSAIMLQILLYTGKKKCLGNFLGTTCFTICP